MRILFAIGFILLVSGAALVAGLTGMDRAEAIGLVSLAVLMRIAVSIEELIVCTKENNIRRFLLNEAQREEIHRAE